MIAGMRSWHRATAAVGAAFILHGEGARANDMDLPEEILVVAGVAASELPVDRVAANVQTLEADALDRTGTATVADALARRLGSVVAVDSLGNALQQGVTLRGFTAAPALGEPQGVAVYQGAMRLNEAFGDVVQWDLLPLFAVSRVQVIPGSNPVQGLNGLGGVVALEMKTGLSDPGGRAEALAGSFGRLSGTAEYGTRTGNLGVYVGASALDEKGWRDASPSDVVRGYADLSFAPSNRTEIGISLTAADSSLTGNGPAPADLLAERRRAVFTYPDRTDSRLLAGTLRASTVLGSLSLRGGAYVRHLRRATRNGDQAEFEECEGFAGLVTGFTPPDEALCFGAEVEEDEVEGSPEVLVDSAGDPVDDLDDEPDAVFNRTRTRTTSWGANAQATHSGGLGSRDNVLIAGATLDVARTRYSSGSELGVLQADRGVESLGIAIGNDEFNVGLRTRSTYVSLFVSNTLSLTSTIHASASLRWNHADVRLRDQIGTALDGDHRFSRVNPAFGLTWNADPALTLYAAYTENNRVPTPAELSCADPERPCRFPNAFLADPPLDDVRTRTTEVGVRGEARGARFSLAAFRADNRDDIIFISAGPIVGTGYFDNVGRTRRLGVEATASSAAGRLSWYASYAFVRATFRSSLTIQAPDNPSADADGEIAVTSGDRVPGVPLHSFKAGADLAVTSRLTLGAELVASSNRYLRGDEANLERPLGGFAVVNASASYRFGTLELFARVDNLFGRRFSTFGIFGEADELGFEDPRFLSPSAPLSAVAGARLRF